jgi:hypothetical protein
MLPVALGPTVLALRVCYRSQGVRWPLRDDDLVEVWDARAHTLYFVITGELLKTLLRHHLDALSVQAMLKQQMEATEPGKIGDEPMPEVPPVTPSMKDLRKAERRSRHRKVS